VVHEHRMRANLDAEGGVARAEGLVAALAPTLGRAEAVALVERVCARVLADGGTLADRAGDEPRIVEALGRAGIGTALAPGSFAGASALFVQRVLARWQRLKE